MFRQPSNNMNKQRKKYKKTNQPFKPSQKE